MNTLGSPSWPQIHYIVINGPEFHCLSLQMLGLSHPVNITYFIIKLQIFKNMAVLFSPECPWTFGILLSQHPECWNYRWVPPCLAHCIEFGLLFLICIRVVCMLICAHKERPAQDNRCLSLLHSTLFLRGGLLLNLTLNILAGRPTNLSESACSHLNAWS